MLKALRLRHRCKKREGKDMATCMAAACHKAASTNPHLQVSLCYDFEHAPDPSAQHGCSTG